MSDDAPKLTHFYIVNSLGHGRTESFESFDHAFAFCVEKASPAFIFDGCNNRNRWRYEPATGLLKLS